MANWTRLAKRYHVGNQVFYAGDVVDLDKYPGLALKVTKAPRDKMIHSGQIKTK